MGTEQSFFSDFAKASKAEWLEKVKQDLKGKDPETLQWELEEAIRVQPFYHEEDFGAFPAPLRIQGATWEIGSYVDAEDYGVANKIAHAELMGGAEAIGFVLRRPPSGDELQQLLEGVNPEWASVNFGEFYLDKAPWTLYEKLLAHFTKQGFDLSKVRGSIDFDPWLDWQEPPIDRLSDLLHRACDELPRFKVLQINGRYYHGGAEKSSEELALTLVKGSHYLQQLQQRDHQAEVLQQQLQLSVSISTSYFVEIAKLRALRILWLNVLRAYGVAGPSDPEIVVHLAPETQDNNPYTNMIRATTQAMSAVIGGADRLYVRPANAGLGETSSPFTRRIARNVQHLLTMEAYFGKVTDPAAGSYYVEKLTEELARTAWRRFQQLQAEQAF